MLAAAGDSVATLFLFSEILVFTAVGRNHADTDAVFVEFFVKGFA